MVIAPTLLERATIITRLVITHGIAPW